ncbi:uroporphyrinogen-III C-methyltransferase [Geobacillus sp. FSL W8-0032]|uniref:Uroporphyrinogen-III C-methyltransferase n=1 Tax=Geobacillus subterraneus TaxID=129338 RepID=A0A679FIT4_9BACL|nr:MULTISPECIES: uroporphyrinogen-III C-methyltransferase [Geobacillus]KYD30620.1 Uroporphyrinogen-III methyltransferase [Geobacillus sp. B4113_201601]BBW96252.1 uroporphyrin-III C-methyltransferase [Geobacillus subterraneus]
MTVGKVYLVGAGPGDERLITVYGRECLERADVVIYDRLINRKLLHYAKPGAELLYCGKEPGKHDTVQEQIHDLLVDRARQGQTVVRLKGGDPCVFGRVGEEAEVLAKAGIPFEIVPGVTSGIAVPAYAGIPVTHRDYAASVAMVSGHRSERIDWEALARGCDTIVVYMGAANLPDICGRLLAAGKPANTPAAIIEWGTTERQRTVAAPLSTLPDEAKKAGISHPAIIIIGEVVRLRETLQWFPERQGGMVDADASS